AKSQRRRNPLFGRLRRYQVAFGRDRDRFETFIPAVNNWIDSGEYGLIRADNGVILLQRGVTSDPAATTDWQAFLAEQEPSQPL
ncbi:MAG: hypothetical protein AAGA01_08815, partial [Cyanobacteria bacterium P01_E01_bin.43]